MDFRHVLALPSYLHGPAGGFFLLLESLLFTILLILKSPMEAVSCRPLIRMCYATVDTERS